MVKDISSIKQQAIKRESKIELSVQQEPILQIKSETQDTILLLEKSRLKEKLSKIVKIKQQELKDTANAAKLTLAGAQDEADRIVSEAKTKALALTTEATSQKGVAETLLHENQTKEKELIDLEQKVSEQEKIVKIDQGTIYIQKKDLEQKQ